jgi:hypothetical protein
MLKQLNQMLESITTMSGTVEMIAIIVFLILTGGGIIAYLALNEIQKIKQMFQIDDFKRIWQESYLQYYAIVHQQEDKELYNRLLENRKQIIIHAGILGGEICVALLQLNSLMIKTKEENYPLEALTKEFCQTQQKILKGNYKIRFTKRELVILKDEFCAY